jgi:hypothetical protein
MPGDLQAQLRPFSNHRGNDTDGSAAPIKAEYRDKYVDQSDKVRQGLGGAKHHSDELGTARARMGLRGIRRRRSGRQGQPRKCGSLPADHRLSFRRSAYVE